MTQIHDRPEDFATTAIAGFCSANARTARPVRGGVVRATATPAGKVALVVGGGSGHYPAFAGFVGPGLADAAVAGDVFASPSAQAVAHVMRLAHRGGGIVLGFGNYAGDVMNFGLAAERLEAEGIAVRILAVTDDVASAPADKASLRRGVAGDLVVFKIVGAAAEAGLDLDAVERVGQSANARTMSFGVAFTGCTLPGAAEPLFSVPKGGWAWASASTASRASAKRRSCRRPNSARSWSRGWSPSAPPARTAASPSCSTASAAPSTRSSSCCGPASRRRCVEAGLTIVAPEVGEYVTSLDMAGVSLTLTWLDDELERSGSRPPTRRCCGAAPSSPPSRRRRSRRTSARAVELRARRRRARATTRRCIAGLARRARDRRCATPKRSWAASTPSPATATTARG